MTVLVENELVANVARDQVTQVAPQEEMIFGLISEAYFQDPDESLKRRGEKDEMLGFGVEAEVVLLTPVVLAVTREVIEFIASEVMKSVQTQSSGIINELELPPIGQGLREGRLSQRYRVHAFRMSRPTMMIALEKAIQKSMTRPWRSVHHTSFL